MAVSRQIYKATFFHTVLHFGEQPGPGIGPVQYLSRTKLFPMTYQMASDDLPDGDLGIDYQMAIELNTRWRFGNCLLGGDQVICFWYTMASDYQMASGWLTCRPMGDMSPHGRWWLPVGGVCASHAQKISPSGAGSCVRPFAWGRCGAGVCCRILGAQCDERMRKCYRPGEARSVC